MQTASIPAAQIPPLTPGQVAEVATAELDASIALLESLDDGDWARPTDCSGWTVHDLTAHMAGQYQELANPGVYLRRHRRVPGLLRRQHLGRMYPEEPLPDDRVSYLLDVLGLRDLWMHRVDLARATGRPTPPGAHDHMIITQVVADLGRAWPGPPALLELTGPAGCRWALGHGTPVATVRADTVDYLRALSGRNNHPGLQADGDPAAAAAAAAARVAF